MYGKDVQQKLGHLNMFLVGAGAIGWVKCFEQQRKSEIQTKIEEIIELDDLRDMMSNVKIVAVIHILQFPFFIRQWNP